MLKISFLGMMSPNDHNEQELGRSEPGGYTSFHSETLQPRADWKCISCVIDTNTYYDIWSCYKRGGTALNLWPCCFFEYHVKLQGESVELGFFLQLNATANWEFHQQKMVIKNGKTYCWSVGEQIIFVHLNRLSLVKREKFNTPTGLQIGYFRMTFPDWLLACWTFSQITAHV